MLEGNAHADDHGLCTNLPSRAASGKSLTFDRPCDGDSGEDGAIEHDRTTVRKVGTAVHQTKFERQMQLR